jgi:hypothetical protein
VFPREDPESGTLRWSVLTPCVVDPNRTIEKVAVESVSTVKVSPGEMVRGEAEMIFGLLALEPSLLKR